VSTPEEARVRLHALLFTGKYGQAAAEGETYAARFPADPFIKRMIVRGLLAEGRIEEAGRRCALYGKAVRREYLACLHLRREDARLKDACREIAEEFRRHAPRSCAEALLAAEAWAYAGRHQAAMDVLQEYEPKTALERAERAVAMGNLFAAKYNPRAALREYASALKAHRAWPPALEGAAAVFFAEGMFGKCREYCTKILSFNPRNVPALLMEAEMALLEEDYASAEAALERAGRVNPVHPRVWALGAFLHRIRRDEKGYRAALGRVDSLPYSSYYYRYALASLYLRKKKGKEAMELLRRLLGGFPDDPPVLRDIGKILLRRGRIAEAKALLERAHRLDGYNVWTYNVLQLLDRVEKYSRCDTKRFSIVYDPAADEVTARFFKDTIEETADALSRLYAYRLPERVYLFFFPKHSYLAVMTIGLPDIGMPALCVGNSIYCDTPNVLKTHLSMNWHKVLRHELVHVYNLLQTDFNVPHWFTEGLAVLSEETEHRYAWDGVLLRASILGELAPLSRLNLLFYVPRDRFSRTQAYAQAHRAVLFLVKRYGFGKIREFLARFRDGYLFPEAVKAVLGIPPEELQAMLDADMADYLRSLRIPPRFAPEDAPRLLRLAAEGNAAAGAWLAGRPGGERVVELFRSRGGAVPDRVKTGYAFLLFSRGAVEEALKVLAAVKVDRDFFHYHLLGRCLERTGDTAGALRAFRRAWEIYRWHPDTIRRIAGICRRLKDGKAYAEWMERYIDVGDGDIDRYLEYALFLMDAHDTARAVYVLERAKRANPAHPDVRVLLGKALLVLGRPERAAAEYEAARRIAPGDEKIRRDLVKILRYLHRDEEADAVMREGKP